jgi:hypothetical protein
MEPLVRPFETPVAAPSLGTGTIPALVPDAILIVQGSGQVKSGEWSWSWSIQTYAGAKQYELSEQ